MNYKTYYNNHIKCQYYKIKYNNTEISKIDLTSVSKEDKDEITRCIPYEKPPPPRLIPLCDGCEK